MTHEITDTDRVAVHRDRGQAWHRLGTLIDDMTPIEAQEEFLPWETEQYPLFAKSPDPGEWGMNVPGYVGNFRSDTKELLGVVTAGYVPVDNAEMAQFCEALLDECGTNLADAVRAGHLSAEQEAFVACCSANDRDADRCSMIDDGFTRGLCHDRPVCVDRRSTDLITCPGSGTDG